MGRSPRCCHEAGVKKGPWTAEEDQKLVEYIQKHGGHVNSWRSLPKCAGLNRCGKSCRLRWTNYLRPDIKRGEFSDNEERLIIHLHSILGNKWSTIATHLEGRTDNEIKNYWNTHIRKKLLRMGIDPVTHQRRPAELDPAALLSAAASLGSLDSALRQVQVLQQLLQAANSSSASTYNPLIANIGTANAISSSTSSTMLPNFQDQMNTLSHATYAGYFSNIVAEQEIMQQLMNTTTAHPVYSSYAAPVAQYCSTGALVSAAYPDEVATGADGRAVQDFAGLEPMELPNLCSLENDLSWKDILESSFLV